MEDKVVKNKEVLESELGAEDFIISIDPHAPLFVIGVTAEVVHIPLWTLRKLDQMGVVSPKRVGVRTRCYSQNQMQTLSYVKYLMEDKKVNISGIKVILEMESRND